MKNSKSKIFKIVFSLILVSSLITLPGFVVAQDAADSMQSKIVLEDNISSEDLVKRAWEASGKSDIAMLDALAQYCEEKYGPKARELQANLSDFPERTEIGKYTVLNDVGTCLFARAEAYMNRGKKDIAIEHFEKLIKDYPYSQAWEPRGWFWSVAEKSQASIDVMLGKVNEEEIDFTKIIRTKPTIHTHGTEKVIDYTKYGEFRNVGKSNYRYIMSDPQGLGKAVGEGIYPNTGDIYNNPRYKEVKKEGRLDISHWDIVNSDDLEAAYFKWFTAPEPWGVRLFYIGLTFEKAGMYYEALKAYHALVVHFPKTIGYTYWQTPWYPAQAAIAKIRHIIRMNPDLDLEEKWMKIEVQNGFDNTIDNDVFVTYPGKIIGRSLMDKAKNALNLKEKVSFGEVVKRVGEGKVRLVKYENGHWQLLVHNKPFIIKGITYAPTKIGQSPDKGTLENWMEEDSNENGIIDGPYEAWVDKNLNNKQDEDEPVVGDFQLMKEMGANTIRIYHVPEIPNKELLREMHEKYGIYVMMGDFIGKYAIGSGAAWSDGTDYENEEHKKNMFESVRKMVMEHKDEPYLLMWLLGNENNYGVACNADKKPEAYFKFANEIAQWIKTVDIHHPVAISNGDTLFLDVFAEHAPDIDIFAANVYRGDYGFGSFWDQVNEAAQKPAFITEFGSPAYARHLTIEEADQAQADYHHGNWIDIEENSAGRSGTGNALGGVLFEWMDEWWKNYEPYYHDKKSDAVGPFPGGYYFEEWFGIMSQGEGKHSPFMRQPRKAYYLYKDLWNRKETLSSVLGSVFVAGIVFMLICIGSYKKS